jgi:hypothetical protein
MVTSVFAGAKKKDSRFLMPPYVDGGAISQ